MKIIEIKQYVLDEEDKKLLSIEIPDSPCNKCYLNSNGCCGCPDGTKYYEKIKPYKDRNILDIAIKIKRMRKLQNEIKEKKKEVDRISEELKNIGL